MCVCVCVFFFFFFESACFSEMSAHTYQCHIPAEFYPYRKTQRHRIFLSVWNVYLIARSFCGLTLRLPVPCHHGMAHHQVTNRWDGEKLASVLKAGMGCPLALGWGHVWPTFLHKKCLLGNLHEHHGNWRRRLHHPTWIYNGRSYFRSNSIRQLSKLALFQVPSDLHNISCLQLMLNVSDVNL